MSVTIDGTKGVNSSGSFYGQSTYTGSYTDGIVVDYTTGTGRVTVGSSDGFKIRNGGPSSPVDLVTVDSSGNVGIGTSSPATKLQVAGNRFRIGDANSDPGIEIYNGSIVKGYLFNDTANNLITLRHSSSSGINLDSSGNLLVGTTSQIQSARLSVLATSATNGITCQQVNNSNAVFGGVNASNSVTFYVVGTGQIYSTSTSIGAISDQSLKENIRDLETGLTEVMALKPRRFDWKEGEGTGDKNIAGFIAQELEQVLPDLVLDYRYSEEETKKSIKMGDILPTLVKAIQEQQAIIQQLQADVTALKGQAT